MLQKAMKDYNRIMGKIGDPIEEQQERGALPMDLTVADLVEDLECMLKYCYSDPDWLQDMPQEDKEAEEKMLKKFIRKYKKYA